MAEVLLAIPGGIWWVKYEDTTGELLDKYNKPKIIATIAALEEALTLLPDITQEALDVASLLNLISLCPWTQAKKDRISELVRVMWALREGDTQVLEAIQITARIERLTDLLALLV